MQLLLKMGLASSRFQNIGSTQYLLWLVFSTVSRKEWLHFYFLNNSVKSKPIWIIFGIYRILKKFYINIFEPVHHTWKMSPLYLVKCNIHASDGTCISSLKQEAQLSLRDGATRACQFKSCQLLNESPFTSPRLKWIKLIVLSWEGYELAANFT